MRRPCARLLDWVTAMINDLDDAGQISDLPENVTLNCQTYYGGMLGAYADPDADPAAPFVQRTTERTTRSFWLYRFQHSIDRTSALACMLSKVAGAPPCVFSARKTRSKNSGSKNSWKRFRWNEGPRAPRNPRLNDWLDKIFPGNIRLVRWMEIYGDL